MAILKGKDILDRVRKKIQNDNYGEYDEINEALVWLCRSPFSFLRKSNIVGAGLRASTKEYDLNLGNVKSIVDIWVAASSTTDVGDIEGITLSGTDPVSIQITTHGLTTGRQIIPSSAGGTTEINDNIYKVTVTDANNFTLDGTDSSDFSAWTSGGSVAVYDINDGAWDKMDEIQSREFESTVKANTNVSYAISNGTVITTTTELDINRAGNKFYYYLKSGDSNPFMKFVVTPTPSRTYKIKVEYLRIPTITSEETIPDIPTNYIDALVLQASAFILENTFDPIKVQMADRYSQRANMLAFSMMLDVQRNRGCGIDRPPARWKI